MTTPPTKCIVVTLAHHLDHLIPMSFYEKIPLIIRDRGAEQAIFDYYPWVPYYWISDFPFFADIEEILCTSFSEIFLKDTHYALYQKTPKLVRMHHGFSDKVQDFSYYDEILDYKHTPNYRLKFYQKFRSIMVETARKHLPLTTKENFLLIALSWDQATVEQQLDMICTHPEKERFLIRVHPLLAENQLTHFKLEAKYGVQLLPHTCPYIYPFLELCGGLLTDCSSIGYDALYFKKPIMVLDDVPLKKFSSKDIDTWITECDQKTEKPQFRHAYHEIFN